MRGPTKSIQRLARHAFDLLLELRSQDNAPQLLSQAVGFLELLARQKEVRVTPIMVSVRVMHLRKT